MSTVFLSLGSNQGDRAKFLDAAIAELKTLGEILQTSSIWETKAWGKTHQNDFFNTGVRMETDFSPLKFLQSIQKIENNLGRRRTEKWGSRTIDIDILFWNENIIDLDILQIPHPLAHKRAFVLAPLLEMNPEILFPNNISAKEYWKKLGQQEKNSVQKKSALSFENNEDIATSSLL